MKILMLLPQPFFAERGSPLNIYQVCKALGRLGHSVDLLCFHLGRDVEIKNVKIERTLRVPFIKHIRVGASCAKLVLDVLLFFKALCLGLRRGYDVIHTVEEAVFLGLILKKFLGVPVIYDMDSDIPQQLSYTKFVKNRFLLRIAERLERWAIKESELVLTVCSSLTDSVLKKCPGKKVFQIEDTPVPVKEGGVFVEDVDKLKKDLGIGNGTVVLYTGNFESYQGVELLIESIPLVTVEHTKVRFVLAGGEEAQIARMQNLAGSLKVEEFTVFAGMRPLREMPVFMELADILVSPRVEGTNTPLKIFTYLQSGKPTVATRLLTHTQVLNDDIAILTKAEPDAFGAGILKLLKNEGLRGELGNRGKRLVEEKYSEEKFAEKVEEVYKYLSRHSKHS